MSVSADHCLLFSFLGNLAQLVFRFYLDVILVPTINGLPVFKTLKFVDSILFRRAGFSSRMSM